jgi:hypothetical protein
MDTENEYIKLKIIANPDVSVIGKLIRMYRSSIDMGALNVWRKDLIDPLFNPPNRFIGRLPGRFSAWQCDDDADLPDAYHPERGWLILNEDGTWKYSTENQEVNDDPAFK